MKRIEIRFSVIANGKLIAAFDSRSDADAWIDARSMQHLDVEYQLKDGLSRAANVYKIKAGRRY